jgi:hypothetical protein
MPEYCPVGLYVVLPKSTYAPLPLVQLHSLIRGLNYTINEISIQAKILHTYKIQRYNYYSDVYVQQRVYS